jgi:hypothetical protein
MMKVTLQYPPVENAYALFEKQIDDYIQNIQNERILDEHQEITQKQRNIIQKQALENIIPELAKKVVDATMDNYQNIRNEIRQEIQQNNISKNISNTEEGDIEEKIDEQILEVPYLTMPKHKGKDLLQSIEDCEAGEDDKGNAMPLTDKQKDKKKRC